MKKSDLSLTEKQHSKSFPIFKLVSSSKQSFMTDAFST